VAFNSVGFYLFLAAAAAVHFVLPAKLRWFWLLAASLAFYGSFVPGHLPVLASVILIAYAAGVRIDQSTGPARRLWLAAATAAILAVLGVFKYLGFLNVQLAGLARRIGWNYPMEILKIVAPIGLAFFTLQALAYLFEVHRRRQPVESHFGILALYVAYFPQITAGPIGRPQHILPQLRALPGFDDVRVTEGLRLVLWGLFKKLAIADRIAPAVAAVFDRSGDAHGLEIAAAAALFAVQIYADFGGYTDIAVGASRVLGVALTRNFDRPYFAVSVRDFWRRWHISLSSWFRDYVFLPLSFRLSRRWPRERYVGVRTEVWIYLAANFATMLLCGLWHGANWTFVVWGGLQAAFMGAEIVLSPRPRRRRGVRLLLRICGTFALVSFAWIFFRAGSLSGAWTLVRGMISRPGSWTHLMLGMGVRSSLVSLGLILAALGVEIGQGRRTFEAWLGALPRPVRWLFYLGLVWGILAFGNFGLGKFIYVQF
jgi:alginate O-acetyltransferase complex protein AlgI